MDNINSDSLLKPGLPDLTTDEKWAAATNAKLIINTCYQDQLSTFAFTRALEKQEKLINCSKLLLLSDQNISVTDTITCLRNISFHFEVRWHIHVAFRLYPCKIRYDGAPDDEKNPELTDSKCYETKILNAKNYATTEKARMMAMFC